MKIYLQENNEWELFEVERDSEELKKRNIIISEDSFIGSGCCIGNNSQVSNSRVNNSRVENSLVLNNSGVLSNSWVKNAMINGAKKNHSHLELYTFPSDAYYDKKGKQIIRMGCYTRTREEWEKDFWNNPKAFPNDNSRESQSRWHTFLMQCLFFDLYEGKTK